MNEWAAFSVSRALVCLNTAWVAAELPMQGNVIVVSVLGKTWMEWENLSHIEISPTLLIQESYSDKSLLHNTEFILGFGNLPFLYAAERPAARLKMSPSDNAQTQFWA